MKWVSIMRRRICILLVLLTVVCLFSACSRKEETIDYENRLFDASRVHEIDIRISDEDWKDLLNDPVSKTKYTVDITIDDEKYEEVSFSTKGNSSLYFVASEEGSQRYSFKINFSKNRKDQTYHGLKKLSLNNLFSDPTYMKDFISYELFRKMDVDAPLVSYAWIRINGKDHGLYLVSEDISESFLKRNYQGQGVIYKPENEGLELDLDQIEQIKEGGLTIPSEANGADFRYSDDRIESYSDIFDNAETDMEEADQKRVITALKGLSEGKDLDKYLDTDEIIRYFAVQVYLLNYDSYIGPMLHNYYLYENKGRLSLIPWDYNLAFATFPFAVPVEANEDPTAIINTGIDSPLLMTSEEDRPMWKWIMEDEGYKEKYHEEYQKLIGYFDSGEFTSEVDSVYEMIRDYVKKDPTAFYTYDQNKVACETLKKFCLYRAASISKQLQGKLSTVNDDQDLGDRIDCSDISLIDLQ